MSASPPQSRKLIIKLSVRTKAQEKKRDCSAVEELELPDRPKLSKMAHEPEQAEARPSTPPQPELSTLITLPEHVSPYPALDLTTLEPAIETVRQRDLSPLSSEELLNFMRVDMMLHAFSFCQRLTFHGVWIHHKETPVYPASLGPLPIEPGNPIAYADAVVLAATDYIRWQLSDIREVTDRVEAQYPLFGPPFSELSALQRVAASLNASLYELVNVHYPSPPVEGNVALMVARVEDLIDELSRYQLAMYDENLGSVYPPPTCLLPIEERNFPEVVAVLLAEVAEVYGLGEFPQEDGPELTVHAEQEQMLPFQDTQPPPLYESIEQDDVPQLLQDPFPSPSCEPLEPELALRRPWRWHTSFEPDIDDFMEQDFDAPNWLCAMARSSSYDEFARQYLGEMSEDT